MKMNDKFVIQAAREDVWAALNNENILRQCIPGCEQLVRTSDTQFTAHITAKVGPVSARFVGEINLSAIIPPQGYTITGQASSSAGFATGSATVFLADEGETTLLNYAVDAKMGGKLAQIGQRLIDGTARKLAGDFFFRFSALVEGAKSSEIAPLPAPVISPVSATQLNPWLVWGAGGLIILLVIVLTSAFVG